MKITAIAASTENNIIAIGGEMPWHCSADLKKFKETTKHHAVIVGRQTFEDMGGKPLPERHTILLTKNDNYPTGNYEIAHTVEEAISRAYNYTERHGLSECFVIGGEQIYKLFAPHTDKVLLSVIGDEFHKPEKFQIGKVHNYFPYYVYNPKATKFETIFYHKYHDVVFTITFVPEKDEWVGRSAEGSYYCLAHDTTKELLYSRMKTIIDDMLVQARDYPHHRFTLP